VLIRINRQVVAKELLHRQNHSHDHNNALTDREGSPCDENFIYRAHHLNDAEKGSHDILLSGPQHQGLNNYQAKDLLYSTLA
jgi:hypothetical protein